MENGGATSQALTREEGRALSRETVNGEKIGRDPRRMSVEELNTLGHEASPMLKVIRAKCLDCSCGQISEVRKCVAVDCALWPYRMSANPLRTPLSEEERQKRAETLRVVRPNSL
jgi:hypothetical protein